MTSIAALPSAAYGPQLERARTSSVQGAYKVLPDQVYDPVLDPTLNPALREDDIEQITVTAKSENNNELSFWDFLDLINPLQHIPVVNTIYRHVTGDTIKTPVQLIGATVMGGPIGFAAAMVDSLIEESTGTDIGGHAMAMLNKEKPQPTHAPIVMPGETQVADAREFIPDDPTAALVPVAVSGGRSQIASAQAARAYASAPAAAPVAPVSSAPIPNAPQQVAKAAQAGQRQPTESEAIVQTAQIAAQANVFPTFKRTVANPGTNAPPQSQQAAAAQGAALQAQSRYMPINRGNAMMMAAPRPAGENTRPAELRARSKFAPGPVNVGGSTLAPATVAAAVASQNKTAQQARAQEAYVQGREAAATGSAPAEMPAWFDGAMKDAIGKYQTMQNAR